MANLAHCPPVGIGPRSIPEDFMNAKSDSAIEAAAGRILVVDDDETVSEVLAKYLTREGFQVDVVGDGTAGVAHARDTQPDLVVLDLMLPGIDGIEVFRQIRAESAVPVVMLTALGSEHDRIAGLEIGADDYVTKPFSPREVAARIKSVLRRAGPTIRADLTPVETTARFGDVTINFASREVARDGSPIELTAKEFDVLAFLATHPGVVYRREDLLESVWGWSVGDTATVTVHIRRLREKIEEDPANPQRIVTVWGVGYRFDT